MDGPISFAQTRMCILDALDFRGEDSTVPFARRIRGPLDVGALRNSLYALVKRHAALRTRYLVRAGKPTAVIDPEPTLEFIVKHSTDEVDSEAFQEMLPSLINVSYQLASGPVMRAFVIHAPGDETVLLIGIHHIAVDGASMMLLARELSELYSAEVSGRPPILPEVRVEYADYAAWQQEWVQGPEAGKQLAYWRQALAGLEELELPLDHPRQARRGPDGRAVPFAFGLELSGQISRAARDQRSSTFMFLLAALSVVLSRYAGQEDVPVGVPAEGRRPDFEETVGLFVNTVVLRSCARGDLTFGEYLRDVREATCNALDNQDVPFDLVIQELRPHRDLSRNPLFEVMFAFDNSEPVVLSLPGATVDELTVRPRTMQFDLGVEIGVSGNGGTIDGQMIYAVDVFEQSTIRRLSEHYERVVRAVTERPDLPLREIELMTPAERDKVIHQAAGTVLPRPTRLAHELFEHQAAVAPTSVAVIHGSSELSYQRLNGDANQVAHHLRTLGLTLEQPVAVCLPPDGPLPTALLGVLKAGGVYLPLDPALPDERISQILANAGVGAVLTDSMLAHRMTAPGVPVVSIDTDQPAIARRPRTSPAVPISPDNLAYVAYTAGSTGCPEPAGIPHRALLNSLLWSHQRHRIERTDRIVGRSPAFSGASIWETLVPLTAGAALLMPPEGRPDREGMTNYCADNGVTVLYASPSQLARQQESARPGSLRLILLGGERLLEEACRWISSRYDVAVDNGYGPAECAVYATAGWWKDGDSGNPTIGTPVDNMVARVLDSRMTAVPPGLRGVLHLGGEGLGRGYLGSARLTAERFVPDPYGPPGARLFVTGDIASADDTGVLSYISRSDRQVRLRGRTVRLEEIEFAVTALPLVHRAVVVLHGPETARKLTCFVTANGADISTNALMRAMRERLPGYMLPNRFVILPEMPTTHSGKTDYPRLQEMCGLPL